MLARIDGQVVLVAGACRSESATGTTAAYYTASQAASGAKLYGARCSACHGVKLQGVSAPALRASAYATAQSVSDVYKFMVETNQSKDLSVEEVQRIKDLVSKVGSLEFRILANRDDDAKAIDDVRNMINGRNAKS